MNRNVNGDHCQEAERTNQFKKQKIYQKIIKDFANFILRLITINQQLKLKYFFF